MKAVVFEEHGGPEVLKVVDIPKPEVNHDEVLLRIKSIGVNFNDIWARRGLPGMKFIFPHISGSDASGVVEAIGESVRHVKIGDEVIVSGAFSCRSCPTCISGNALFCDDFRIWGFQTGPNLGAQAEFANVPAANVLPKPKNITWEEAATLSLVLSTAWRMLVVRAKIKPGDFILVWGGGGGLGTMAIQICKLFGAHAIAVAGSDEKLAYAQSLGAEYTINRNTQRLVREVMKITKNRGVDIVFEHVGAETWENSVICCKPAGSIVICGATSGFRAQVDLRFLWNKQQNHLGSHYGTVAELADALKFVETGMIKPTLMTTIPLEDVAEAHDLLERGKVIGKIALIP